MRFRRRSHTPVLTARITPVPGTPVRGPSRVGHWLRAVGLTLAAALLGFYVVSLGASVTAAAGAPTLNGALDCPAGSDFYNNAPVTASSAMIDIGAGGDGDLWQKHTDDAGVLQLTPTGTSAYPHTPYEYYGAYFPFTSGFIDTDSLGEKCGNVDGPLGSTIPSLLFALGSAMTTVLIAVYRWATDTTMLNALFAPIDCIVAGKGSTSIEATNAFQLQDAGALPARLADGTSSTCKTDGLVNSLYLNFITPVIALGALWIFWQAAIKRRSSEALKGGIWMTVAIGLSLAFMWQPMWLPVAVNNGISYVNEIVLTKVVGSVAASNDETDLCYINPQPHINSALQDAGVRKAVAEGTYEPTPNLGSRTATCILWKTLIFDAWVMGQFGDMSAANKPLNTETVYNNDDDSLERRKEIARRISLKFPNLTPSLALAQLETTVVDHDEIGLIRQGANPKQVSNTVDHEVIKYSRGETGSDGTCHLLTDSGELGDEVSCPEQLFLLYSSTSQMYEPEHGTFNSFRTSIPDGSTVCRSRTDGSITRCSGDFQPVSSYVSDIVVKNTSTDDFKALWNQIAESPENASWAALWAGHSPSQRYSAAVTAVVGALIGGLVITVLGFVNVLYQIGMLLLIMIAPFILLIGIHPGAGRRITTRWLEALLSTATKRVLVSVLLGILVTIYAIIYAMNVGWLQKVLLIAAVGIGLLMYRKQLTQMVGSVNFGTSGAEQYSGPASQAQRRGTGMLAGGTSAAIAATVAGGGAGAILGAAGSAGGRQMGNIGGVSGSAMRVGASTGRAKANRSNAKKRQKAHAANAGRGGTTPGSSPRPTGNKAPSSPGYQRPSGGRNGRGKGQGGPNTPPPAGGTGPNTRPPSGGAPAGSSGGTKTKQRDLPNRPPTSTGGGPNTPPVNPGGTPPAGGTSGGQPGNGSPRPDKKP